MYQEHMNEDRNPSACPSLCLCECFECFLMNVLCNNILYSIYIYIIFHLIISSFAFALPQTCSREFFIFILFCFVAYTFISYNLLLQDINFRLHAENGIQCFNNFYKIQAFSNQQLGRGKFFSRVVKASTVNLVFWI